MSERFPLLRSLDPHHQRVGYLNGVMLSAIRGLDRRESIVARFFDLMFQRVQQDDPLWGRLFARVPEQYQQQILSDAEEAEKKDPHSILIKSKGAHGWVYIHELWRYDNAVYSHLGGITHEEDKIARPVELAKWLELLLPTYELSEHGFVIQTILNDLRASLKEDFNPMRVRGVPQLELGYLRAFLASDCLFPILVCELVERSTTGTLKSRGDKGLLRVAIESLLSSAGTPARPDEILEFQGVMEFQESVTKSIKTEENYLRPRMEILVDLGIIDRDQSVKPSKFPWIVTDVTRRAAADWKGMAALTESSKDYLERRFFGSMAKIFNRSNLIVTDTHEILSAFASSYARIGREFGFTPARTIALFACLEGWAKGMTTEIPEMLGTVRDAAKTEFGQHLHFSGGSRFDDEFLIRIDPQLNLELAKLTGRQVQ